MKKILLFLTLFFTFLISFCSSNPTQEEIQEQIDAAVEQAVEEALSTTSDEYTVKTDETTTTMQPVLAVPVGNYWGQYDDGTWAIVLSSEKPENFKWAWDVFNREDPSGYYGFDEFDENSTLIGTLVDFDCSFNRISKTEEHKEAFGVFETTIEYYDTYFDWAEDNYDYLTEEAVLIISKIMRGVWTCDYQYLESISTEYLDFVNSGDAYAEVPKFSDYITSFENNYDDDHRFGKYTYTLGALLYMTPAEAELPVTKLECDTPGIEWIGNELYQWPMESKNPKQLREIQVAKMSMFDNGLTKSLIDGTYQGDDGTYGFRLQITTEGIWKAYKYTGHTWPSGYSKELPYYECPESTNDAKIIVPQPESPNDLIEGEVSTYGTGEDYSPTILRNAGIVVGDRFDIFVILLEKNNKNDLLPGPYTVIKGGNPCITDEGGCKVPDDFDEYLTIRGNFWCYDFELSQPTWPRPPDSLITTEGSNLVAKSYGCFEGQSDFLLKIEPGATFRSYRTANPPAIVIEVDK